MGKVYIGADAAVDGLKLWGVGGKKVVKGYLGGLGEWVSGGRLTARRMLGRLRAGHARPLRGGGRVRGCWPGTGRRRGQDPSLRWWKVRVGGIWRGCAGGEDGYDFQHSAHVNVENTCNFYLIIIV